MILLVEPMLESKDNIGLWAVVHQEKASDSIFYRKTLVLKFKFLSGQHQKV